MPMGRWLTQRLRGLGLLALVCLAMALHPLVVRGDGAEGPVLYHNTQAFRIPFSIDEADRTRLQEVRLYVSSDLGQRWNLVERASPTQTSFTYRSDRDAEYWFAVRTLDRRNRLYPPDDAPVIPSMRVVVDTVAPRLSIDAMGRRGSRVKVRWEIADANLLTTSLSLWFRAVGAPDWREVPIDEPALIGAQEWEAGTAAPLEVRATVEDRAGNAQTGQTTIPVGVASAERMGDDLSNYGPPPPITPIESASLADPAAGFGGDPFEPAVGDYRPENFRTMSADLGFNGNVTPTRPSGRMGGVVSEPGPGFGYPQSNQGYAPDHDPLMVSSPRFNMQYAVDGAGMYGPALVELWYTRDGGRSWTPLPEDADHASPYPIDLGGEGLYGLWLVVQSASGLGDEPPVAGSKPMQWVVVDSTVPQVRLLPPKVGHGPALGKVLIEWEAADAHLDDRPVLLSYRSDEPGSTWTPITDRLDNTGQYIWVVPPEVPPRLHLRVDVLDRLNNRAADETTSFGPIVVDRSRPRGRILGLESGQPDGPDGTSRR